MIAVDDSTQPPLFKRCCRCKSHRPIDEFTKDRQTPDGLNRRCRARKNALAREGVQRNPERRRAYLEAWREKNRERLNAQAKQWRDANREAHLEAKRRWRERNPTHSAEYYEANRDAAFDRVRRRRALKYGATIGEVDIDALWTGVCPLCDEGIDADLKYPDPSSKSLDHIVPLSKGGTHEQANLQWVHLVCNLRKGARAP